MSEKIKVFIVNRDLHTTLKATVDFLSKEPRVETIIFDQQSTYPPTLEYYKECGKEIVYNDRNGGPQSVWGLKFNNEHFIVTDSDCTYTGVPDDWLDVMLRVLEDNSAFKVGFSLRIDDLPVNPITNDVKQWEAGYWKTKNIHGWVADVDTTFALYRPHSPFSYSGIRLDIPYCIRHMLWYITKENISEEWKYYLEHASGVSCWGTKLKTQLHK
jgi:hypothetical protein